MDSITQSEESNICASLVCYDLFTVRFDAKKTIAYKWLAFSPPQEEKAELLRPGGMVSVKCGHTKHARIVFANSIRVKLFKSLCKVLSTTQKLIVVYSSRPPSFNTISVRRRAFRWTFKAGVTDDCHFWLCSSTLLTRSWSLMHKSPRLARLPELK